MTSRPGDAKEFTWHSTRGNGFDLNRTFLWPVSARALSNARAAASLSARHSLAGKSPGARPPSAAQLNKQRENTGPVSVGACFRKETIPTPSCSRGGHGTPVWPARHRSGRKSRPLHRLWTYRDRQQFCVRMQEGHLNQNREASRMQVRLAGNKHCVDVSLQQTSIVIWTRGGRGPASSVDS